MGKTNFDRITASPEALAAFLASLPCLDAPWDDAFHRHFCDNCPMEDCPKVCPNEEKETAPRGGWGWRYQSNGSKCKHECRGVPGVHGLEKGLRAIQQ